jgi:hypothetical protein
MIGSPLSIQQQQQGPNYYHQTNQNMPPTLYNHVPDPRTGLL